MIPATALAYLKALEENTPMPLKPKVRVKAKGIPLAGVIVKTTDTGKQVIVKKDSAQPHVRAGRRRKANRVTGVRAAK